MQHPTAQPKVVLRRSQESNLRPFCGFPGYKPVPPGWFKIGVGFITAIPKGSPKVVFKVKPRIEPATVFVAFLGINQFRRVGFIRLTKSVFVFFVAVFLGCTSTGRVGLWFYVQELSKAQPAVVQSVSEDGAT